MRRKKIIPISGFILPMIAKVYTEVWEVTMFIIEFNGFLVISIVITVNNA